MDAAQAERIRFLVRSDPIRWRILGIMGSLDLPDCWTAAGFVRNAVWDHLHGREPGLPTGDVDVDWFDPSRADRAHDKVLEARLSALDPSVQWSVKNQARMHLRNDDPPYGSTEDAMRSWPETATAVAVRRRGPDTCHVLAPFGLHDLFGLILRPAPRVAANKRHVFEARIRAKRWQTVWPLLRVEPI
jgi:hypothetical protein